MYTRSHSNENEQSFRRGEYSIPANYRGNAFSADEIPNLENYINKPPESTDFTEENINSQKDKYQELNTSQQISPHNYEHIKTTDLPYREEKEETECSSCNVECKNCENKSKRKDNNSEKGLLGSLLSRFNRGFSIDDWLLIGLVILLLEGGSDDDESHRGEIIAALAFLFLSGF